MTFRAFLLGMRASAMLGKASKLAGRERHEQAREVLARALALVPAAAPDSWFEPGRFSVRLALLKLQSQVAARLGDVPLAVASIREALPLWLESGLPRTKKLEAMSEWEEWAREYLTWAERGEGSDRS